MTRELVPMPPLKPRALVPFDYVDTAPLRDSLLRIPEFTISVARGARDRAGNVMPTGFSEKFRIGGFYLEYAAYTSGNTVTLLETAPQFVFSAPIDPSTVAGAVHLTPGLAGGTTLHKV